MTRVTRQRDTKMSIVIKLLSAVLIIFALWNYLNVYQFAMFIKEHFEYTEWIEIAAYSLNPIILRFCFATLLIIGTVKSWLSLLIGCFIYLSFQIYRKFMFAYEFCKGSSDLIYHDDDYEDQGVPQEILINLGKTNKCCVVHTDQ